jgi:hypothetical protein
MKNYKILAFALFFVALGVFNQVKAQRSDTAYMKTIQLRAEKIVQKLEIKESKKSSQVSDIVANQYIDLNEVFIARDLKIKEVKALTNLTSEVKNKQLDSIKNWTTAEINKLHIIYLKKLNKKLNPQQVIAVKDGMTYGVVPLTFNAYQQMLPNLTADQKAQIYAWLVEARELAMDAESSEKKHAWFGKYKGRINNYLSAAGIDLNKAGTDWAERIKAEKSN